MCDFSVAPVVITVNDDEGAGYETSSVSAVQ